MSQKFSKVRLTQCSRYQSLIKNSYGQTSQTMRGKCDSANRGITLMSSAAALCAINAGSSNQWAFVIFCLAPENYFGGTTYWWPFTVMSLRTINWPFFMWTVNEKNTGSNPLNNLKPFYILNNLSVNASHGIVNVSVYGNRFVNSKKQFLFLQLWKHFRQNSISGCFVSCWMTPSAPNFVLFLSFVFPIALFCVYFLFTLSFMYSGCLWGHGLCTLCMSLVF